MGGDVSKRNKKSLAQLEEGHCLSRWRRYLSSMGVSGTCHLSLLRFASWQLEREVPVPEHLLPPAPGPEKPNLEWTLPGFISIFLPEFPHRRSSGQQHLQILGFIAKGSYGPILKVKDLCKQKTYAIKVLAKSEILKHGVLQQSKEEVIIQRQVRHPFLHDLQDCWQTQHHLFISE